MEVRGPYAIRLLFHGLVLLGLILCADYGRRQMMPYRDHRVVLTAVSGEQRDAEASCQLTMLRLIASLKHLPEGAMLNETEEPVGPQLRESLLELNQSEVCDQYREESTMPRSAMVNILRLDTPLDDEDVTLVTQVSLERLERLAKTAEYWKGPMSVTVYLKPSDVWSLLLGHVCGDPRLRSRENIMLHLSFIKGMFYPVNFLRNVALNASASKYVYLTDADMIPAPSMYDNLVTQYIQKNMLQDNQSLVIPAFGAKSIHHIDQMPSIATKADVLQLWDDNVIQPFLQKKKVEAHRATNFKKWKGAKWPYEVKYEQDFEPYIVMRRRDVPPYNERFVGRNRNKLSHLEEVAQRGVKFLVAHDLYTVHVNHTGRETENQDANKYLRCTMAEYRRFKQFHLNKTVGPSLYNKS